MLLMKLEAREKFSFLQLAHYLARIDNDYGEKEQEIILEYCAEMGIENDDNFDMNEFSLEEILKDFRTEKSKKIVVLELMILIHADDKFDLKERTLISKINDTFKLSPQNLEFCSQWGKGVAALYSQGKLFINN
ncbi:TerB family tellurite resistance protein [Campylobacterota bacterium DY0563]|uniref:tellurite resistance TerB family protein n=1 Tax=Halarcobacter sp. TaxID=2321133 RepID=UPI0029F51D64|nr:TerB family tellurite resistance protein [Halarcobacter sp.]